MHALREWGSPVFIAATAGLRRHGNEHGQRQRQALTYEDILSYIEAESQGEIGKAEVVNKANRPPDGDPSIAREKRQRAAIQTVLAEFLVFFAKGKFYLRHFAKKTFPSGLRQGNFVTFCERFLLTKLGGKFDLPISAARTKIGSPSGGRTKRRFLVQSTQNQARIFYTSSTCTKHVIFTNSSLL